MSNNPSTKEEWKHGDKGSDGNPGGKTPNLAAPYPASGAHNRII